MNKIYKELYIKPAFLRDKTHFREGGKKLPQKKVDTHHACAQKYNIATKNYSEILRKCTCFLTKNASEDLLKN